MLRASLGPVGVEISSLADAGLPEPSVSGRNDRQHAIVRATVVSAHTGLPAAALVRSFTIDPLILFGPGPDPQFSASRDYPTWSWRVAANGRCAGIVDAVRKADQDLWDGGYCGPNDRGAYFLTTLCFAAPARDPHVIARWCAGQFYLFKDDRHDDPVDFGRCLIPTGHRDTLADMPEATRESLHDFRAALRELTALLAQVL